MEYFTKKALEQGPWSVSKAKTAIQCPWKYNKQYVERFDVPADMLPDISDTSLRVGSAVHKYAEEIACGTDTGIAEEMALEAGRLSNAEEETFATMLDNVHSFEERIDAFKDKYAITGDYKERKFGVTPALVETSFFAKDVFLRGVMDRTLIVSNKHAIIIDIKTGSFPSLKYSEEQISAYSLLALRCFPDLVSVKPALYFVPAGRLLWAEKVYRKDIEDPASYPTVKYINQAAEEAVTDRITPGKYCGWCPYKMVCLQERKERRARKRGSK